MAGGKRKIALQQSDALVVVDLQNDFCPGGALAVPGGDKIVPVVNKLICGFSRKGVLVFASYDYHPPDHCSFKTFGGNWPPHCQWDTNGVDLHPDLDINGVDIFLYKGLDKDSDAYSAFDGFEWTKPDNKLKSILRGDWLLIQDCWRKINVKRIFVAGLATDYCVKATVLDGIKLGFEVHVVIDAIAAVNVNPDDGEKALREMVAAGAKLCESKDIKDIAK